MAPVQDPSDQPDLRSSDAEREQAFERLSEHAAAGRLTLQELEDRVERVYAAKTRSELEVLTGTCRRSPPARPPAQRPGGWSR